MENKRIKLGLKNFRAFSEYQEFELAPFTLLTGPNNSGKNILHQALRIMANSFKEKDESGKTDIETLHFHNASHKPENFTDNYSHTKNSSTLTLILEFYSASYGEKFKIHLKYNNGKLSKVKLYFLDDTPHLMLTLNKDGLWFFKPFQTQEMNYLIRIIQKKASRQDRLLELYKNIHEKGYNALTNEELKEIKKFEKEGVIFNRHPTNELDEYNWDVYYKKDKTRYPYYPCLYYPYKSYPPPFDGLTIKTCLLDDIITTQYFDDIKLKNKEDLQKINKLQSLLQKQKIYSKETFIKKYQIFETFLFGAYFSYLNQKNFDAFNVSFTISDFFKNNFKKAEKIGWEAFTDNIGPSPFFVTSFLQYIEWCRSKRLKNISTEQPTVNNKFNEAFTLTMDSIDKIWNEFMENLDFLVQKSIFSPFDSNIKHLLLFSEITKYDAILVRYAKRKLSGDKKETNEKFIIRWLKEFRLGSSIDVGAITAGDELIGATFSLKRQNQKIPLTNNSTASNQLLLLILQLAMSEKNSLFLLSKPEANFHPAFQSQLAELLVAANKKFGHTFIIGSRSEYLIRKFQLLTAQKRILPHDTQIYYFHHPDFIPSGEKQIKKISIYSDGTLDNDFGAGFFDESARLTMDLLKYHTQN